jgi:hypothetical protein
MTCQVLHAEDHSRANRMHELTSGTGTHKGKSGTAGQVTALRHANKRACAGETVGGRSKPVRSSCVVPATAPISHHAGRLFCASTWRAVTNSRSRGGAAAVPDSDRKQR